MANLIFFRQARVDGAVRTGIEGDGASLLESIGEVPSDPDPALLWFIDVCATADDAPVELEDARRWFLEATPLVQRALREAADHVALGIDPDVWPLSHVLQEPDGRKLRVVVSAVRRLDARNMAGHLRQLADEWVPALRELAPLSHV